MCYIVMNLLFMVIDKTPQVCTGPFVFEILQTVTYRVLYYQRNKKRKEI